MSGWSKQGKGGFGGDKPAEGEKPEAKADAKPEAKKDEKPELKKPDGWEEKKKSGAKAWSEGARTDNPDKRTVLAPTGQGIGDGKVFHFLFGLKIHSPNDRRLFKEAREHIDDDVEELRKVGYTCVVDEEAVHDDFTTALYGTGEDTQGLAPAGIFWLAHGHDDGAIECSDGGAVQPADIESEKVHADLKLVVFAACYTGSCSRTWRKALGGRPLVVGWGRPVTIDRAVDFLTPKDESDTDLDDLIRRYLLSDTPVPAAMEVRHSPLASAASAGRAGDLSKRLEGVVAILHAKVLPKKDDTGVDLDIPLGTDEQGRKRWHRCKVFIVDGNEPFCEGETILGVECDVGEITSVVDAQMLLSGIEANRYARATLVQSDKDMPNIVTQGFLPLSRVRDMDVAAMIFQTCQYADVLEHRIFGGDRG